MGSFNVMAITVHKKSRSKHVIKGLKQTYILKKFKIFKKFNFKMLKYSVFLFLSMFQGIPAFIAPGRISLAETLQPIIYNQQQAAQLKEVTFRFQ